MAALQTIYNQRWAKKHPKAYKQMKHRYSIKHRETMVKNTRGWRRKNVTSFLLSAARRRAKKKGLAFNLTPQDIVIPAVCPVLGIPLERGIGHPKDGSPSLDRTKPELGYVRGNIQVMSTRANTLKNNGTLAEFEKIVRYMKTVSA